MAISSLVNVLTGAEAPASSASYLVDATAATLTVTQALHDGKCILMDKSGGIAFTLPAATGTGMRLRFVVKTVSTTGYTLAATPTTDIFKGNILTNSTTETPDLAQPWPTSTNSNLITLNGTTTGGVSVGDWVTLTDIASGVWAVDGLVTASGTEATPFSHV